MLCQRTDFNKTMYICSVKKSLPQARVKNKLEQTNQIFYVRFNFLTHMKTVATIWFLHKNVRENIYAQLSRSSTVYAPCSFPAPFVTQPNFIWLQVILQISIFIHSMLQIKIVNFSSLFPCFPDSKKVLKNYSLCKN